MSRVEYIAREYATPHFSPISNDLGVRWIILSAKSDWISHVPFILKHFWLSGSGQEVCVCVRGEDWPKIAHIPNIRIAHKVIQGSDAYRDQWNFYIRFGMPLPQFSIHACFFVANWHGFELF